MKQKSQAIVYNEHDQNQVQEILRKRKSKKKKRRIKIICVLLVVILIVAFMCSPLSKVKKIKVSGNQYIEDEYLIENSSLKDTNQYYFFVNKSKIKSQLEDLPLVHKVNVNISLLGDINIKVIESSCIAYGKIKGKNYVIDSDGQVTEVTDNKLLTSAIGTSKFSSFKSVKTLKKFAKNYIQIPKIIRNEVSDIVFSPKDADPLRVKLILDNGKIIFIRIDEMVDSLKDFAYEAYMSEYSDRCGFSFEGDNLYIISCNKIKNY